MQIKADQANNLITNKLKLYTAALTVTICVFLFSATPTSAVTCTSQATGDWNATGTWSGCTGGDGSPANTPGPSDTAVITTTHTVTVTASQTVGALQFGTASTAGVVSVNTGVTLTVTNNLDLLGVVGANTAGTITGLGTVSAGTITIGSDIQYTNPRTITFTSTISTLTVSGNLNLLSYAGNPTTRAGNPTFNHQSGTITVQGSVTSTNEGSSNVSTYTMATGAQSGTLNLSAATPWSLSETGTNTITLNGSSAVVNYNGTSAQTVLGTTYTTLKINNSNSPGATLGAAATVSTLTIGDVTSNSRFNDGGFQLTSTGTLNLTSGYFKLGAANATTWPNFGTRNISSGTTVEYASTASQTYSTVPTYHHLTFTGNSTKSPSSTAMTVNGNLTISGGTMTAPSGNFTLLGNFNNAGGTFSHNSGTVIFAGADSSTQAITGSNTFYNFTASTNTNSAGRTLQFAGSSTTTVSGTWTITGYSGKIITLQSSNTNNWTINPSNASVTYVDVYRSTNELLGLCATYSAKDVNTTGWSVSTGDTCVSAFNCESNIASGNWNSAASWTSCDGGYPNSDDTATILNGHTITLNANAVIVRIDIQNGGTLSADSNSRTLTLNGTTGTLFTLGGTGTFTANNSTVIMNPDAAVTLISGSSTFYNLTLSPTITAARTYTAGAGFSASNNLTINPTASSTFRLTVNLGGTTTVTGSTLISGTTSGVSTLDTVSGSNYSFSTGLLNIATAGTLTANNSTITLTGTSGTLFTRAGTFNPGGSTVNVTSASGTPTLNSGTVTFYALTIDPSSITISTSADDITVTNTLNIATGDTLSLTSGQNLTHSGATLTLNGTLSGDGLYIYQSVTAFPTTGTITADLRMDATNGGQRIGARTYGGNVEVYNNSALNNRTTALGTGASQTLTFSGDLTLNAANTASITLTGDTYNPIVNIAGNFASISGGENVTGNGIWTVSGNVDLTEFNTFTSTGSTFQMNGTDKTLTSAGETFNNFSVTGGTVSNTDALGVGNNLSVSGGVFTQSGTAAVTNDVLVSNGATYTINANLIVGGGDITTSGTSSTINTTSGTPTVTMRGTGSIGGGTTPSITFYNLTIGDATTATTTIASTVTTSNDLSIGSGSTMNGTGNVNVNGGDITGAGIINMTGGTFTLTGTGNLGSNSDWIFNNLTLGTGSAGTTSATGTGYLRARVALTISSNHILNAGTNKVWYISGGGNTFVPTGTFNADTSTLSFNGNGNANIPATNYYHLNIGDVDNLTAARTYIALSGTVNIGGDLLVGAPSGSYTHIFDVNTNDPALNITGSLTTTSLGTYSASSNTAAPLTIGQNFTNNGTFTHNNGKIVFNSTNSSTLLYASATTFRDFSVETAGKQMYFDNADQTNIEGAFTVQGTDCTTGRVFLDSDVNNSAWEIYVSGTHDIDYADIEDSTAVTTALTADNSTQVNAGNTNWTVNAGVCDGSTPTPTPTPTVTPTPGPTFTPTPQPTGMIQPNIRGNTNIRGGVRIQ